MSGASPTYRELFEEDVKTLFPSNSFPPDPNDRAALRVLDDILDYLPTYVKWKNHYRDPEPLEVFVRSSSEVMHRHARLHGFRWVVCVDGAYLAKMQVEEIQ